MLAAESSSVIPSIADTAAPRLTNTRGVIWECEGGSTRGGVAATDNMTAVDTKRLVTTALLTVLASAAECSMPVVARGRATVATRTEVAGAAGKWCNAVCGLVITAADGAAKICANVRAAATSGIGVLVVVVTSSGSKRKGSGASDESGGSLPRLTAAARWRNALSLDRNQHSK